MTLIGGFEFGSDGILCADTLEETAYVKYSAEKLDGYDRKWCQVGFAGSGENSDLIDAVVDRVKEFLDQEKPESLDAIKRTIRDALTQVYKDEIAAYPQPAQPADPVDTRVVLLMLVHGENDSNVRLLASDSTMLHEVATGYDVRGIGEIVRFAAKRLYNRNLSLAQGVALCVHLLGLSKKNVTGVGGDTHILILRSDGWMRREQLDQTELTESFFEKFDKASADALLSFADTSLTDEEFDTKLQDFVQNVTGLRGELVNQMATSVLAQVLNDPNFKDPLKRLPDATRRKFGKTAARYFYDEEGRSGYGGLSLSTSPSASVSPSASLSPSASASPSPGPCESSEDGVSQAIKIVEESLDKKDPSNDSE